MRARNIFRFAILLGCLTALLGSSVAHPASAQSRSAVYERFDVELTVLDDGTFRIEETQTVRFTDGPFSQGHRSIPLARIAGVENIAVYEIVDGDRVPFTASRSGELDTFHVVTTSTEVDIRWTFPSARDETRTFVVAYDLAGALRYYPDAETPNQQIWYIPIGAALTSETPVESGTFSITLPRSVAPGSVILAIDGDVVSDPAVHTDDYRTFTFSHGGFRSGESWEIRLQTDVVALDAEVPVWQEADDARRQREEDRAARETRIAGLAGIAAIALLIFGGLGIFLLWFARGRDPHTGAIAAFLPEPPDETPPAIVGVLIDERVHEHDIVSTFTDWGRRGIITIHDLQGSALQGNAPTLELNQVPDDLTDFERKLLAAVFPRASAGERTIPLASARGSLKTHEATLEEALYQEVERRGYFQRSPESTRNRWRNAATVVTSLSIVAGILGSMLVSSWLLLPAFTITALSIALRLTARVLPQRTEAGAEAAEKWRAFERYLRDLERYDTLDTARANFERFLPYAIVFGIETTWVNRFRTAGAPLQPSWLDTGDLGEMVERIPGGRVHRGGRPVVIHTGGGSSPSGGGGLDLPGLPDLQKTSDSAARGLGGASRGAVDLLNVLGVILEVVSIFAGGGKSGGGSGGGGGGFR